MALIIKDRPSPNHNDRHGATIDCIVIHDTESADAAAAISWFESPTSKASAHYVIDRDGRTGEGSETPDILCRQTPRQTGERQTIARVVGLFVNCSTVSSSVRQ